MPIDKRTGLAAEMGVTDEMMACPLPRVPLIDPQEIPVDLQPELQRTYARAEEMWGTVPRYLRMLGHAPAAAEAWVLLDQKLRIDYLKRDPDYVRLQELVIVKTALITECNN